MRPERAVVICLVASVLFAGLSIGTALAGSNILPAVFGGLGVGFVLLWGMWLGECYRG